MAEKYESNIKLLTKWLENIAGYLFEKGHMYVVDDGGSIDKLYKAMGVISQFVKISPSENIPISDHFQINSNWMPLIEKEFYNFNNMGDEYICSISEATIKILALKRAVDNDFESPMFFRGEHNFGWELISRLGRSQSFDWEKFDVKKTTEMELKFLKKFIDKVKNDDTLKEQIFGVGAVLSDNDPGWWSIMQHYDEENGTRLIDITSSLYSALYFSCVDWDGTIDSSVDGKLYMFPYPPGRGETYTPDRWKNQIIGPDDQIERTLENYFDIQGSEDIPRVRISPIINHRVLSQDGYFIWQPYFDQPLKTFQIFTFRIHRDFKAKIVKELNAFGYTKDRILAKNRFNREKFASAL